LTLLLPAEMVIRLFSAAVICIFAILQIAVYIVYLKRAEASGEALSEKQKTMVKRVGMFTPYALVPGGGEKYFLSSAAVFQNSGYRVDILIRADNPCRSLMQLMQLARSLRVDLKPTKLRLRVVWTENLSINSPVIAKNYYSAFYLLGNEKFPQIQGIGSHMNIYMCQFPFDMYDAGSPLMYRNLASYQLVILNSMYSLFWYNHLIQPTIDAVFSKGQYFAVPTIKIVHPPVNSFPLPFGTVYGLGLGDAPVWMRKNESISSVQGEISIVMLGRFFEGRQNKGHRTALRMIKILMNTPGIPKVHLTMIGNVHPNENSRRYVSDLREMIQSNNLYDFVTLITSAKPEDIERSLRQALIVWHLTGIEQADAAVLLTSPIFGLSKPKEDPASYEHFGIAVVEAMGSGCIPIALNKGGVTDIISHGINGYLTENSTDLVSKMIHVLLYI